MSILRISILVLMLILLRGSALLSQDADGYPRAMQGPMLGNVTPTSFTVWVRTSWTFPVQVSYSTDENFVDAQLSGTENPDKSSDYCVNITVDNLKPATRYFYRLVIDGEDKVKLSLG